MYQRRKVTVCGHDFTQAGHICAFFDSKEQQYDVLLPYFQEGLDNGEQVVSILDSYQHNEHLDYLRSANIPLENVMQSEQLKVLSSDDTYTYGGVFAVERMFTLLENVLIDAQNSPFSYVRTCGDMEWALKNLPGTEELIEYEARANTLLPKYDCTLMCVYDLNRFSGRTVVDILATHPQVIMNGRVHQNPYYVPPLAFLQQLLHRRSGAIGRES